MKTIPLTRGLSTIVDDEDYERVAARKWWVARRPDADYAEGTVDGKQVVLHRFLTGAVRGQDVDHINGDGLDNRRENLRVCNRSENMRNMRNQRPAGMKTSRFKGVHWDKSKAKWRAYITYNTGHFLGRYDDERDAAEAYDRAALSYFGEFAHPNFPKEYYL